MLPPGDVFAVTAVPGIFGNLVTLALVDLPGGANYTSSVTGFAITLTIGTTGGDTNIDWASIAALFNADAAIIPLASMEGATGDFSGPSVLRTPLVLKRGGSGTGLGQYYTGSGSPGWLPQYVKRVNA
jgi:hypothetical protein